MAEVGLVTWARAAACWVLAAILLLVLRATAPSPEADPATAPDVATAEPAASPDDDAAQKAYDVDLARLDRVEVRRDDRVVVLERTGEAWKVVTPTDRVIPPGLVQAFVQQLADSGHGERIGDDASDPAFGLAAPGTHIEAWSDDGSRLRLAVGARTPAGTSAYALVEPDHRVVLLGLNLLYYADLLLG
jgi:hypothetical protein